MDFNRSNEVLMSPPKAASNSAESQLGKNLRSQTDLTSWPTLGRNPDSNWSMNFNGSVQGGLYFSELSNVLSISGLVFTETLERMALGTAIGSNSGELVEGGERENEIRLNSEYKRCQWRENFKGSD